MKQRPLAVTIIGWVYIAVGLVTFSSQVAGFAHSVSADLVLVETVRLLAVVAGVFLLRGRDWARWLALAWIAFHVVLSAFHSAGEFAMHSVFCAVIGYFLLRAEAWRYFRGGDA